MKPQRFVCTAALVALGGASAWALGGSDLAASAISNITVVKGSEPAPDAAVNAPVSKAAPVSTSLGVTPSLAPVGYTLAFADEFDGTALNTANWYYRITDGKYVQGYMRSPNVSVTGGTLHLRYGYEAVPGVSGNQYTGGGVISRPRFGYGYYEVRAKLYNAYSGAHTSFWSMGLRKGDVGAAFDPQINTDIDAGMLPEHAQIHEIDGFEHDSGQGMDMGTQHQSNGTVTLRTGAKSAAQLGIDFAAWNIYAWELTPTNTRFYLNGVLKLDVPTASYPSPFAPANFWLSLLPYSANPNPSSLPGFSEFDYFHFYAPTGLLGANLLANSSFDVLPLTNPPTSLVSGWQENYDKSASNIIVTGAHSGTRALRQGLASAYTVTDKQDLRYIPNGTYQLTAYVKCSGGQSQAVMRVLNQGAAEIDQNIGTLANWTQITIGNIVVTSGQATIAFSSIGSGGQSLDIDDVVFARVS